MRELAEERGEGVGGRKRKVGAVEEDGGEVGEERERRAKRWVGAEEGLRKIEQEVAEREGGEEVEAKPKPVSVRYTF